MVVWVELQADACSQEKCFLQGVGPQEIRAYRMEELLSENQLNDMAGNAWPT